MAELHLQWPADRIFQGVHCTIWDLKEGTWQDMLVYEGAVLIWM